jgi:hypothetical protein
VGTAAAEGLVRRWSDGAGGTALVSPPDAHGPHVRTFDSCTGCRPVGCSSMVRLARRTMPWSSSWIDSGEAQACAMDAVAQRGLPWTEPITVMRHWGDWRVMTWSAHRGGSVFVDVDGGTGAVKWIGGPTPR